MSVPTPWWASSCGCGGGDQRTEHRVQVGDLDLQGLDPPAEAAHRELGRGVHPAVSTPGRRAAAVDGQLGDAEVSQPGAEVVGGGADQ